MNRIAKGFALLGCILAATAQAQTTAGYYRTCANYNPDYQEVYDNVDSSNYTVKSAALDQYLRDSGCRKQVIKAIETVKDQNKQCAIPRHPDYDTYQKTIIGILSTDTVQGNQAFLNASIDMVAPEIMKQVLKCQ